MKFKGCQQFWRKKGEECTEKPILELGHIKFLLLDIHHIFFMKFLTSIEFNPILYTQKFNFIYKISILVIL